MHQHTWDGVRGDRCVVGMLGREIPAPDQLAFVALLRAWRIYNYVYGTEELMNGDVGRKSVMWGALSEHLLFATCIAAMHGNTRPQHMRLANNQMIC